MNITIPTTTLSAMLGFAAKKDVRYYLIGLCVDETARGTFLVGTTGSILAAYKLDDVEHEVPKRTILPRASIETALKAAGKASDILITDTHIGLVPYTPIDGRYPDWQATVPKGDCSGIAGQLDIDLLVPFQKASNLICGKGRIFPHLWHNGAGNAVLVTMVDSNFVGVIMPLRSSSSPTRPSWI